ncbi:hypothetical protein SDC9_170154 [bioreactor metagenome]|uniref:Uncharacterized protein n=1 Tax=bioreactor metagenome TaxID=1076179 RepID=A0A645G9S5_9ZZZZ
MREAADVQCANQCGASKGYGCFEETAAVQGRIDRISIILHSAKLFWNSGRSWVKPDRTTKLSGTVRGKYDFVCFDRIGEACEGHFLVLLQGVEESLKLRFIRMIRDITRIEQFHG